jgi:hypothetical protein
MNGPKGSDSRVQGEPTTVSIPFPGFANYGFSGISLFDDAFGPLATEY